MNLDIDVISGVIAEAVEDNIATLYGVNVIPDYEENNVYLNVSIDIGEMDSFEFLNNIALEIAGSREKAEKYDWLIDRFFQKIFDKIASEVERMAREFGLRIDRTPHYIEVTTDKLFKLPDEVFTEPERYLTKYDIIHRNKKIIKQYLEDNPELVTKFVSAFQSMHEIAEYLDEEFYSEKAWRTKHLTIPMLMKIKEEIEKREVHMIYPTKMTRLKSGTYRLYIPNKILEIALKKEQIDDKELLVQLKCENGAIKIIILNY